MFYIFGWKLHPVNFEAISNWRLCIDLGLWATARPPSPTRYNSAQIRPNSRPIPRNSALKRDNSKKGFRHKEASSLLLLAAILLIHQWPLFASHSEIRAHRSWMTMESFDFERRSRKKDRKKARSWISSSLIPKYSSLLTQTVIFPFLPYNLASSDPPFSLPVSCSLRILLSHHFPLLLFSSCSCTGRVSYFRRSRVWFLLFCYN